MTTKTIKPTNKDFRYAVKYLKKNGYEFDSRSKTWSGTKDVSFLTDEGYATDLTEETETAS